jgi:hypothetical protein
MKFSRFQWAMAPAIRAVMVKHQGVLLMGFGKEIATNPLYSSIVLTDFPITGRRIRNYPLTPVERWRDNVHFLKTCRNLSEGQADAFISSIEKPELLSKPFEYEPTMNRAMTNASKKVSNRAWDELAIKLSLGADPTEAVKTMALLLDQVKEGSIGSLKTALRL